MTAGRVVGTETAVRAAQQIQSLLGGGLEQRVQAVAESLRTLSNPAVWDGPQAAQFRSAQAPRHQASLAAAVHSVRQLGFHSEQVTRSIMDAGSQGSLSAHGPTPLFAAMPCRPLVAGDGAGIDPSSIPHRDDPGVNAAWLRTNDAWWHSLSRDQQRAYFREHLDLAAQVGCRLERQSGSQWQLGRLRHRADLPRLRLPDVRRHGSRHELERAA